MLRFRGLIVRTGVTQMIFRMIPIALALLTIADAAGAQSTVQSNEPVVVVTGEGLVKAAPDRAFVTFSVESRSKNPKDAQSQNAKVMTAVQERLVAASLPKDAIRTLSYDLNLRIGLGQRPPGAARLCGAQHHRSPAR